MTFYYFYAKIKIKLVVEVMKVGYISVFERKSSGERKLKFCNRIHNLILMLYDYSGNSDYKLLNKIFLNLPYNNGFSSIDDLLDEGDTKYYTFRQMSENLLLINDNSILANIDILINCLTYNEVDLNPRLRERKENYNIAALIIKACTEYLFSVGLKMEYSGEKYEIIENEVSIDINQVQEQSLKEDILTYYNYINKNSYKVKKEVLTNLIIKLESNRTDIQKIFGKGIEQALFMYGNSLNLRHDNITSTNKGHYKPTVAKLTEEELIEWYDYVYPLAINTYIYLKKLKNVNCTNDFK